MMVDSEKIPLDETGKRKGWTPHSSFRREKVARNVLSTTTTTTTTTTTSLYST